MLNERRRYPRSKPDPTFRFNCHNADFEEHPLHRTNLALKAVDISAKGICLVTAGRLRAGVPLSVIIDVPDTETRFRGKAVVRWSQTFERQGREAHVAGVELTDVLEARGEKVLFLASWSRRALESDPRPRTVLDRTDVFCLPQGLLSALGLGTNVGSRLVHLSEGACEIVCVKKLKPGARVLLRLTFKNPAVVVSARGEVRTCRRDTLSLEPRFPTEIEFRDLTHDNEARIRLALKAEAISG